ncbi:uncharacterized protein TRAVEDRAFT_21963 [Trametes versicolor FP-101664 SS1]|uniref:uncharacterized protein n=1 Tax=Trametes versicolor (strain FP-101664) TaxID=717944 RepID=UPI0004623AA3|nr:uncharacterized protein TRAVEDRAFT_21963 [Trametes versicolor FP-101664 SS1]EIW57089.1 hypothetical protein TRAVEDRAFT_21963 [Trametes versicolor FP-101664 SS1]
MRVPGGPGEYYKLEQNGLARMWQGPFEFHICEPHNRTGALPRLTPSIYDALYGRRIDFIEKEVEDPIQRNSKWKRIELVIQWPGYPSRRQWIGLTKRSNFKEAWLSRAELYVRICEAYRAFFEDMRTSGVESTEPDWTVWLSRTDLKRLYVVALWFCGEHIFYADVDYDVMVPAPA